MNPVKELRLRMDRALHKRLKRAAREDERSINSEINFALKEWLDERDAPDR